MTGDPVASALGRVAVTSFPRRTAAACAPYHNFGRAPPGGRGRERSQQSRYARSGGRSPARLLSVKKQPESPATTGARPDQGRHRLHRLPHQPRRSGDGHRPAGPDMGEHRALHPRRAEPRTLTLASLRGQGSNRLSRPLSLGDRNLRAWDQASPRSPHARGWVPESLSRACAFRARAREGERWGFRAQAPAP